MGQDEKRPPQKRPLKVPEGSLPPYNLDVEESLLGMLMHDQEQLHEVLLIVRMEDFFRDRHQIVFAAIKARYDLGKAIDFQLVIEDLEASSQHKRVGGDEFFAEMAHQGQCSWNAKEYAQVVKQHAIARSLIEAGNETLRESYSREFTSDELLSNAEARIFAIAQAQVRDDTVDIGTVANEAMQALVNRAQGKIEGVMSGLREIDRIVGCLPNSGLIILAARPAMGKTSLALNICEHNAYRMNAPALFVSLEMERVDLGIRFLAGRAGISGKRLQRANQLTPEEWRLLMDAQEEAQGKGLHINHTPGRTVSQIAANVRLKKAQFGIKLVVIDYMSLINMQERRGESRQEAVAKTSRQLKELARTQKLPILTLCQLNRAVENREDRRPRMADLRESGQIEQDADLVLLLNRPEYYDKADRPGEAELLVAKNRFGDTGCARLAFLKELTRFEDLARPSEINDEWHPDN